MSKRRWRVYQASNMYAYEHFKDYRFRWYARWIAWLHSGDGLMPIEHFTTRVDDLNA